jgi:hypothetical protein
MPTRVVDVRVETAEENIRVLESKKLHEHYVALSHCWGEVQPLILTRASYSQLIRGVPLISLTQTFQVAISITRSLGI